MARIRKIEISNFRGIKSLTWLPKPGFNCLIGRGDSSKSTVLDAIDLCLGARRYFQFNDTDFFGLDVETPVEISVTIGELDDTLKGIEAYGIFLRGFNATNGNIEDEPGAHLETVLTVKLTVQSDLEPVWSLVSERAAALDQTRNLIWADRTRLAPTRIATQGDHNLSWRRGSVLNRLSEERADTSTALVKAARDARTAFGEQAKEQLATTLSIVTATADELGIYVGESAKALLDAHSISFTGGTICLHDQGGVPLHGLGVGSTRLLIAGLQRKAAEDAKIILVDELEYGIEPHRIIRLLGSLGAKDNPPPLQVFATTHSPVALCELSGDQLFILRVDYEDLHHVHEVGTSDDVQGTIRLHPGAFLAESVIVGEGASEVGLIRGIDLFRIEQGIRSMASRAVALVDGGGGSALRKATALEKLHYHTALVRDSDLAPAPEEADYLHEGGDVFCWADGRALEDELFLSLDDEWTHKLLEFAVEFKGELIIDEHIKSASAGKFDLANCRKELTVEIRTTLGKAAKSKNLSWFKSVGSMERVAREIVGPGLETADSQFRKKIEAILNWIDEGL
jgi:hypothetical protein